MSLENPHRQLTPGAEFPLKYWFGNLSRDEQLIIEDAVFNQSTSITLETAFERIKNQKVAQGIMSQCREYLAAKESGMLTDAELNARANVILATVEEAAFPENNS